MFRMLAAPCLRGSSRVTAEAATFYTEKAIIDCKDDEGVGQVERGGEERGGF